jgi:hypothetical protein
LSTHDDSFLLGDTGNPLNDGVPATLRNPQNLVVGEPRSRRKRLCFLCESGGCHSNLLSLSYLIFRLAGGPFIARLTAMSGPPQHPATHAQPAPQHPASASNYAETSFSASSTLSPSSH